MRQRRRGPLVWNPVPGTVLRDVVKTRTPPELVEDLAIPHRARASFWRLMELETVVIPDVRQGLHHPHASVRAHSCEFFDHFLVESVYPDLLARLVDEDKSVRATASHALACDRCTKDGWHPPGEAADLVARAIVESTRLRP